MRTTRSDLLTPTTRRGPLRAALTVTTTLLALGLAACGSGGDHNDADVAFATEMIPHHAQALEMATMVDGTDVSPEVQQLAADIEDAQDPEIATMSGWLDDWDEPLPEKGDMGDVGGTGDMAMPGMMSSSDMSDLAAAEGADFERLWLTMMVEHHTGAIEMAEQQVDEGGYEPAVSLAEDIAMAQAGEIATMTELLAR